ncbi:MAG: CalY family protein [Candidatus Bathyarchaeota archaeon]|nr:CalY family protein [Candidatus Bathyarchaeota archaeon]
MNKKILASIFIIGLLAFGLGWGTYSYFSDTEKSTGNVFTAGTIDIKVTGTGYEWSTGATLADMKPCDTKWITFVIENVGGNPVKVWKRITNIVCDQGLQTEPEIGEEAGTDRCWLPPYILYDLKIPDVRWIVKPEQQIRIDNINGFWIYLGEIPESGSMTVEQSYHLSSWQDAPELDVTNWAQGDTMTFDIELYAEQVSGVGPAVETLVLEDKNPTTWEVLDTPGKYGEFTYGTGFTFKGYGLVEATEYSLIYYKDPWPGTGSVLLASGTGSEFMSGQSGTLPTPIPKSGDKNYPVGGKIWLVLSSDFSGDHMIGWHPADYLFEMHLINVP